MYRLSEINALVDQARTGDVPPVGNLEAAKEIFGFAFGIYFDTDGRLEHPGPVNEALADFIVNDEVLRSKNMTLQEELAIAVEAREPRLSLQIDSLKTVKAPFKTYNTYELLKAARPGLVERNVGS